VKPAQQNRGHQKKTTKVAQQKTRPRAITRKRTQHSHEYRHTSPHFRPSFNTKQPQTGETSCFPSFYPPQIFVHQIGIAIFADISGQRSREGESVFGSFFARCFYTFSNHSMDVKLTDGKSELRLLSKRAVDVFISLPEYNRFNKGLYEWIGFKEKVIPYKNEVRKAGKSKFGFKKSMNYAVKGIISFNDRPLRICIQFGFVSMALSLLYIIYEFFKFLFSSEYTSGYFTTIAAIILFSSVQLIFIGVLGEYIGKIYYEVKRRPHFIIDKTNIRKAEEDKIG